MLGICKSYETAQSTACQGYKNAGSPALECFPKARESVQDESFYSASSGSRAAGPVSIHQSMIAAPQVKPEPKATIATFIPRFNFPLSTASASRIGIVAAVVLP